MTTGVNRSVPRNVKDTYSLIEFSTDLNLVERFRDGSFRFELVSDRPLSTIELLGYPNIPHVFSNSLRTKGHNPLTRDYSGRSRGPSLVCVRGLKPVVGVSPVITQECNWFLRVVGFFSLCGGVSQYLFI